MNQISFNKSIPIFFLFAALLTIPTSGFSEAFAESQTIRVADHLKNNPLAMKIIKEMEAQKIRYKQHKSVNVISIPPVTTQQVQVEEKRKIASQILAEDMQSMQKKYESFTPTNAFAKFVSNLHESYQGIFWDQFNYLKTKVQLATAARNAVIQNGGTYYEAQSEYFKFASMPRADMISYIQELNVRYGFADKGTQENFDANGKLPRYENDDGPCVGCASSVVQVDSKESQIKELQTKLTQLRADFFKSSDIGEKKSILNSLNETAKKIRDLTNL